MEVLEDRCVLSGFLNTGFTQTSLVSDVPGLAAVTDPNLLLVASQLEKATGFQLYLDQAYPPAWGEQIKDSVAQLLEGQATPDQVAKAITNAAKQN